MYIKKGCVISLLISSVIFLLFCYGVYSFLQNPFMIDNDECDKKYLTDNYDNHETEIANLIVYFKSIIPSKTHVDIGFNSKNNIDIYVVKDSLKYGRNNLNIDSNEAKTIFSILNWDKSQIEILKDKLDEINCFSIDNNYPTNIGFLKCGFETYGYTIFDEPIAENDSLIAKYSKCEYIYYKDNVSLRYMCGAVGSYCFPKRFFE